MKKSRHKIRGVSYTVEEGHRLKGVWGDSDQPWAVKPRIRIVKGVRGLSELEVLLHEGLHAAYPDLDEEAVKESGRDLAAMLYKLGYRRVDDANL